MKMTSGFSWMAVTLVLMLFAGNSFAAVDSNELARIVGDMLGKYDPKRMFSMAVSIPEAENRNNVYDTAIFSTENGNQVKSEILNNNVYAQGRIVAAKFVQKTKTTADIHAEYRVLQNFDNLLNKNFNYEKDLLLFYVFGSPCYHQCTNANDQRNILQYLKKIMKWRHYAFVFTDVFKSKNKDMATTEEDRREALTNIANVADDSGQTFGLGNIFRCIKSDNQMSCTSCLTNGGVTPSCVSLPTQ